MTFSATRRLVVLLTAGAALAGCGDQRAVDLDPVGTLLAVERGSELRLAYTRGGIEGGLSVVEIESAGRRRLVLVAPIFDGVQNAKLTVACVRVDRDERQRGLDPVVFGPSSESEREAAQRAITAPDCPRLEIEEAPEAFVRKIRDAAANER